MLMVRYNISSFLFSAKDCPNPTQKQDKKIQHLCKFIIVLIESISNKSLLRPNPWAKILP